MMPATHTTPAMRDGWYVVPHEVVWADLDAIGHVNNVVYFTFFESARIRFWMELRQVTDWRTVDFTVARAECDFRRELHIGEQIEICVRVGEMRSSSFDFVYEIRHDSGREVAATGKVVAVMFDWEQRKKREIPQELRDRILSFQAVPGGE